MPESTLWAIQDKNQFPALLAHTGTAGTADVVRVTATNGALDVNVAAGSVTLTTGDIEIGAVELKDGTSDTRAKVTSDNNLKVVSYSALIPKEWDNGVVGYPDGTTETYTFKSGTTPTGTVTLTYLDTNKGSLNTFVKS